MWWIAGSMLAAPSRDQIGLPPADLPVTNVSFASGSGATLRGWFVPGSPGRGVVVLMHGVHANRRSMAPRAGFLHDEGFSVLLCDFQAHGQSTGNHITFGYLESRDAQAQVGFVRQRVPGERVGVIGMSLGGAAAILASPPLDVDAMVLESVYPSIEEAVSDRMTARVGPWSSVLTPLLTVQLRARFGFGTGQLRPIDHVGALRVPKLFIAGTEERSTTIRESEGLFRAAAGPKELWEIRGARHQDLYAFAGEEYRRRVLAFLTAAIK
jgi:uncharacterized protein